MKIRKSFIHDLLSEPANPKRSTPEEETDHQLNICTFSNGQAEELHIESKDFAQFKPINKPNDITWYHWVGIPNSNILHPFLSHFAIHDLVTEDIRNPKQQPKFEDYGDYIFITSIVFGSGQKGICADQIYLLMGKNFVISFQRKPLGLFTQTKKQLLTKGLPEEHPQADFLLYLLIDRIVDDYFVALERLNEKMEKVDQKLFEQNNADILPKIHRIKRDAIRIKRTLNPIHEGLNQIIRGDFPLFAKSSHIFVRDTTDHCTQLNLALDNIRDTVQSMMDIYLSYQSNALNKQMRVLTTITIIFMPLTLITGIYGMNFDHMPELHWRYGYFAVLLIMCVISTGLLRVFYKQNWL